MTITTDMQTRVIDLAELHGEDEFPAFAAIYSTASANPFVLSPTAMRWGKNIYLCRPGDCKSFWLNQKKKLRCKLTELFAPLLQYHYGEDYVAVFGEHPWQCLLYLDYQVHHQARGLYLLQSRLNRNVYKSLDWECWFGAQDLLAQHLDAINARGFRYQAFSARQAQMRRFIQRIGIATPFDMSEADANAIGRRFGKWLALIWRWSFSEAGELQNFPWITLRQKKLPRVERDLEYPVNQWSCVELFLREDLQRLCDQLKRDDSQHINRMQWQITLFNHQTLSVELSFRHPYSLHRDQPGFETALYQARYLYDDLMSRLQARDTDLDLPENMPFLCWRIEIRERISLSPLLWELFARDDDDIDYQRVKALQNKLPLAFECYRSDASFLPEHSFCEAGIDQSRMTDFDHHAWSCGAINKPLFYYPAAQPIENPGRMQRVFLERNSNQWWLSEDALQSIRDYFIIKDRNGRASWAFRTRDGAWFKQGEFC